MDDNNWVKARSSIAWIAAIGVAFGAVWWIEKESGRELIARQGGAPAAATLPASPDRPPAPAPRALTAQEREWAQAAWAYFERNTDAATGLTAGARGLPSASPWDMGSSLLALIAARDLGLVDEKGFDDRMGRALVSLARLPLREDRLPGSSYDVRTLAMTDDPNPSAPERVGGPAAHVGRLVVPLTIVAWQHPRHTEAARGVIARWATAQLVRDGQPWGPLGYGQYAARSLLLLGLELPAAAHPMAHLKLVDVEGVAVPADDREPHQPGGPGVVASEPWILQGLEFGLTPATHEVAWRVSRAQEQRLRRTGIQADTTGAAFGWHALLRTASSAQRVESLAGLADPAQGWAAGLDEAGGKPNTSIDAATNAMVLESLAGIARGPSLQFR